MHFSSFFASIFALISLVVAHNERVPPYGEICYFEKLKVGDEFSINFQVGTRDSESSEQLDIDFYADNPSGQRIFNLEKVADSHVEIPITSNGNHKFCFSNAYSGYSSKDITFHVNHVWGSELRSEEADSIDGQLKTLQRIVEELAQESEYLRIRERTHRNTAESTNERVKWWSIAQLVIVVGTVVFQVAYLKRFFEVKSSV